MEAVFLFKPNTLLQLLLLVVMMMMREGDAVTDTCLFCVSDKEERVMIMGVDDHDDDYWQCSW